jgi:hypothetical protein
MFALGALHQLDVKRQSTRAMHKVCNQNSGLAGRPLLFSPCFSTEGLCIPPPKYHPQTQPRSENYR